MTRSAPTKKSDGANGSPVAGLTSFVFLKNRVPVCVCVCVCVNGYVRKIKWSCIYSPPTTTLNNNNNNSTYTRTDTQTPARQQKGRTIGVGVVSDNFDHAHGIGAEIV